MTSTYVLAQLNIGLARAPIDSPVMAGFVAGLAHINALADAAPGFIWRLQTETGNATDVRPFDDEKLLVNMSVWRDVESLHRYVYQSEHVEFMRRRREWFEPMTDAFLVLWWIPADHTPSVQEAVARLEHLRQHGPSAHAFGFRTVCPPPDSASNTSS